MKNKREDGFFNILGRLMQWLMLHNKNSLATKTLAFLES